MEERRLVLFILIKLFTLGGAEMHSFSGRFDVMSAPVLLGAVDFPPRIGWKLCSWLISLGVLDSLGHSGRNLGVERY